MNDAREKGVLAVMDDDRYVMECAHKIVPCQSFLDAHNEARTTVAELIEKSNDLAALYADTPDEDLDPVWAEWRAALARANGEFT